MNTKKILIAAFLCLLPLWAHAATHTAASPNQADVLAKINAAANGDTIQIPAGTARWTNGLNVGKSLTIIGAGPGVTVLNGPIPDTTYFFNVANSGSVRISGLTIDGKGVGGGIRFTSPNSYHRVDHCIIQNTGNASGYSNYGRGVQFYFAARQWGLIDHVTFTNNTTDFEIIGDDAGSWLPAEQIGLGTKDAVYIEDCTLNAVPEGRITGKNSGTYNTKGAKTVFRHNVVNYTDPNAGSFWDSHGNNNMTITGDRGTVFTVVEDNQIYINRPNYGAKVFYIRGGIFIAARNVVNTVGTTQLWVLTEEECWYASAGSGNYGQDWSSYPRVDQITNSWIYGNTLNGASHNSYGLYDGGIGHQYVKNVIVNDRDVFLNTVPPAYNPNANRTASGPSHGYTPFVYPHPMASGGPMPTPTPAPTPTPGPIQSTGVPFAATVGAISQPFAASPDQTVSQTTLTATAADGGKAVYRFDAVAGQYMVQANVSAPSDGENSLFANIDSDPIEDMIWGIPANQGFQDRKVSWGNDIDTPRVWTLNAGVHELIVRGREPNVKLKNLTVLATTAPTPTPTPSPSPSPTPTPQPTPTPPPSTGLKISDIEGLQEALDAKSDKGHVHTIVAGKTEPE